MAAGSVEDLWSVVANLALPPRERRQALDALVSLDREAAEALVSSGRLAGAVWPPDEAGRGIGGDDLVLLAVATPPGELLAVLERAASHTPDRVVLAVRLAAARAPYDRRTARRLEPAVRALLVDRRRAFPHLEHTDQTIGGCVQELHLLVARAAHAGDPQAFRGALEQALRATLDRGEQVSTLYNVLLAWLEVGGRASDLLGVLVGVLADRSAGWRARLAAREAVDVLRGVAASYPEAAADLREVVGVGIEAANRALVAVLRDAEAPVELREAVVGRLHRWAPLAIGELQREGVLEARPVPSRRVHRDWTPAAVELLSTQVSFEEVESLIRHAPPADLDRVVSAVRLAPALAGWLPGAARRLDPLLRGLVGSRVEVPMKTRPVLLGQMALEAFVGLFPHAEAQEEWMDVSLRDGLEHAMEAGCSFLKAAEWFPNILRPATRHAVGGWMLDAAREGTRPLAERHDLAEALESAELPALAAQARRSLG